MQKNLKRVLVTGGTGFIGRNLIESLAKKYELVCIVKDRSYKRDDVKIIYGDITDEGCIRRVIDDIDAVVHLAAILNPFDKNITKVNIDSTRLLVDMAKVSNVKKFIFISSENVLYDFDDAYTTTKRIAENIVKSFPNHLILRPTTVYGRYDKRYVKRIVNLARKYNVIPIPGDGKRLFQPVYVEDVVRCIENGLKYNVKGEYTVAGPSKISYDDFVNVVLKELHVEKTLVHIPLSILKLVDYLNKRILKTQMIRLFQVRSLEIDKVYDIRKSVRTLRYKPTPFNLGIRKTIKFLKRL